MDKELKTLLKQYGLTALQINNVLHLINSKKIGTLRDASKLMGLSVENLKNEYVHKKEMVQQGIFFKLSPNGHWKCDLQKLSNWVEKKRDLYIKIQEWR